MYKRFIPTKRVERAYNNYYMLLHQQEIRAASDVLSQRDIL